MAVAEVPGLRPSDVRAVESSLRELVSDLHPEDVPVAYATQMWTSFAAIRQLADGALTLLARRVEETRSWERAGFRSAADHLASIAGNSSTAAKRQLHASHQLEALPATADAVRAGKLSAGKVEAIANAAASTPEAERELLRGAADAPLAQVREDCLRAKARGNRDEIYARIRNERYVREWTDGEGAWNLMARGTPDDGARFRHAFEPIVNELFEQARVDARRAPREAYAFDALIALAERADPPNEGKKPSPRFMGLVRADHEALRRGHVEGDEVCEIAGLGPIPVKTARELLGEAIVKLVITKGVDVVNVTNLGRPPTVAQKIALWWRSPTCGIHGCTRTSRLEYHHTEGWAKTHRTRLDELGRRCDHHHDLETYDGWAAVDDHGRLIMVPPDHHRHPRNGPAP